MATTPPPGQQLPQFNVALLSAILLGVTGGSLDTIVYLNHGHVFANAMTGNVVFLGIAVASAEWSRILPHLTPILAYALGVSASRLLRAWPQHGSALLTLSIEIVTLAVAGLLPPQFPAEAFTAIIAFVSAFQVSNFRREGRFSYNSTFVTGNLRTVVESAWDARLEPDREKRQTGRQQFVHLGLICLAFLAGAAYGALVSSHHLPHDVWWAEPPLLAVLLLTLLGLQNSSAAAP